MVEEEASGQRMAASNVPGLSFGHQGPPQSQPYGNPYNPGPGTSPGQPYGQQYGGSPYGNNPYNQPNQPSNYYRQMPQSYPGNQDVTAAWICGALGLVCCPLVSIAGIVLANRAKQMGNPNAQAPYIFSIVVTCIGACIFLFGMLGGMIN